MSVAMSPAHINIRQITAALGEMPGGWAENHEGLVRLREEVARQLVEAERLLKELPESIATVIENPKKLKS